MASYILIFMCIFLSTTTTTTISAATTTTNSPSPPPPPPQNTTTTTTTPIINLNSIINILNQTQDFNKWAHFLTHKFNPNFLPPFFTLLVPSNHAFSIKTPPKHHILNHFLPLRFSPYSLHLYPNNRILLPTLGHHFSLVLVANDHNYSSGLSINGAKVTHPNLYEDSIVSVHGISSVITTNLDMNVALYNHYYTFLKSLIIVLLFTFIGSKLAGGKPHMILDAVIFSWLALEWKLTRSPSDEIRALLIAGLFYFQRIIGKYKASFTFLYQNYCIL